MRMNIYPGFDIDKFREANKHLSLRVHAKHVDVSDAPAAYSHRPVRYKAPIACRACDTIAISKTDARRRDWMRIGDKWECPDCTRAAQKRTGT